MSSSTREEDGVAYDAVNVTDDAWTWIDSNDSLFSLFRDKRPRPRTHRRRYPILIRTTEFVAGSRSPFPCRRPSASRPRLATSSDSTPRQGGEAGRPDPRRRTAAPLAVAGEEPTPSVPQPDRTGEALAGARPWSVELGEVGGEGAVVELPGRRGRRRDVGAPPESPRGSAAETGTSTPLMAGSGMIKTRKGVDQASPRADAPAGQPPAHAATTSGTRGRHGARFPR